MTLPHHRMFNPPVAAGPGPGPGVPTESLVLNGSNQWLTYNGAGFPGAGHNARIFTISFWAKAIGTGSSMIWSMGADADNDPSYYLWYSSGVNGLENVQRDGGVVWHRRSPTGLAQAWHHYVMNWDARANNAINWWVDGAVSIDQAVTDGSMDLFPGSMLAHWIGRWSAGTFLYNGKLFDFCYIDGQALTPTAFAAGVAGSPNPDWYPIDYTGSYGGSSHRLKFDGAGIGDDSSGNGFNYTAVGSPTTDAADIPATP